MKSDMGGMKKFMPKTYWTFIVCTLALIGIPPFAGFWSKDEILNGAHSLGANNGYEVFLIVGVLGAFMTAAYMTRCVYLTFFGEPRGAAADPHHHPHESGPAIVYPLYFLAAMAVLAGFANFPFGPDAIKLRFEHYVQPVGDYFPPVHALEFNWAIAGISTLIGATGIAIAAAYYWRGAFQGATKRFRLAHAGHTLLVNKYYFDHLYTGVIAAGTSGPIARAANWINQNVIDGVVNGAGIASQKVAGFMYGRVDQKMVDGVVNGSGAGAEGSGQILRRIQTGKVQQYGALLFGGAVILAGVLVFTL
jgi:NADH-quinone oxidoreductase subunit L